MTCTNTFSICVIRGTNYALDVGLSAAYVEVIANPAAWRGVMVFRDQQEQDSPVRLTLAVVPELVLDDLTSAPIQMHFRATPEQTASLPDWDLVYYVDLEALPVFPATTPAVVNRLFQGPCGVSS